MSISASDFRLYHGNDLSLLAGVLSSTLQTDFLPEDMLVPETILIPQPAMKRWLQLVLAEQHGIAANLRFLTPGEFVREALDANRLEPANSIFAADTLRWRLFSVLSDRTQWQHPALNTIAPYLRGAQSEMKAWSLANECAAAFEKYQAWRRDWLADWDRGASPLDWQAHLWRIATQGKIHRGHAIGQYLEAFEGLEKPAPKGLPARLFVFACLNVSPDVLRVIATAAKSGPLHFFLPSPSKKYWGDIGSFRERLKNPQQEIFDQEENPLLQAWGRAGRDFIATLFSNNTVSLRGDVDIYEPSREATLLARVKNDLLERQSPGIMRQTIDSKDTSLQIHSCHTPLREVQVLHDQLHRLFLQHADLQARDIAIMAPDIDTYAPFIEAVFGAARHTPRFIPYRLSDRKLQESSPLVELFLRLLDLPGLELTSNEVLDFLTAPALADVLSIDDECRRWWPFWIEQAGARWGLNATHRQLQGVPADHFTTWAFALDRLLLGYASGTERMIKGVAPVPEVEGQALNALDKLISGLRLLARYGEYFRHPHTAGQWAGVCAELLNMLDAGSQKTAGEEAALHDCQSAIADLQEQCGETEFVEPISTEVVRNYFRNALEQSEASQNFLGGGVTVCRMVPMRQIPFRVICLLGLNEGQMPRNEPPGVVQRLSEEIKSSATRRYGDRSLRDDDRFLFLQLLSAAETSFYLSYCGKHPRDDSDRAPSSLVSELLDCLALMHPGQEKFRENFVVQHPLQVFSADETPDPRRLRFDPAWKMGPPSPEAGDLRFIRQALAGPQDEPVEHLVEWLAFKKFFRHPTRYFLQNRIGLRLDQQEESLAEQEPLGTPSGLQRYQLRHAVFDALLSDGGMVSNDRLLAELRSKALLPSGFSAEPILSVTLSEVQTQALRFRDWCSGEARTLPFELKLGRFVLQGNLDGIYPAGAARIKLGEMKGRHHCMHGLDALLLSALHSEIPLVEFVESEKSGPVQRIRPSHAPDVAIRRLQDLLEMFAAGQCEPLAFDPDAGFVYIGSKHVRPEIFDDENWEAATTNMPDRDIWWLTALRGQDPLGDAQHPDALARRLAFHQASFRIFEACAPDLIGKGESADD